MRNVGVFLIGLATLAVMSAAILLVLGPGGPMIGGDGESAEAADGGDATVQVISVDTDEWWLPPANTIDAPSDSDADTTPDTEETPALGHVWQCASVGPGDEFHIDIVAFRWPSRVSTGPSAGDGSLVAYDITVTGGPGLTVTGVVDGSDPDAGRTLISADPQSGPFIAATDPTPKDLSEGFRASVVDLAPFDADEDIDGTENVDGTLLRLSLAGWFYPMLGYLTVTTTSYLVSDEAGGIPVTTVMDAYFAVGMACPWPDWDLDEFLTWDEIFVGTDLYAACSATSAMNDEDPDAWPPDMNDDQAVNLLDLLATQDTDGDTVPDAGFKGSFNTDMDGTPNQDGGVYHPRFDLDYSYSDSGGALDINLMDLLPFKQYFGLSCTP